MCVSPCFPMHPFLTDKELEVVRHCAWRGAPLGDQNWVKSIARRLGLESTLLPRGCQEGRFN